MAKKCTFCGNDIEPGTGTMYAKKDGTIYHFCSSKCRKNLLKLKRDPKHVRWTKFYRKGE
jgi:large subunit ribosomal protein L24e